jgi:two-component system, chemotaxis family, CheB/CheR fusion protein
MDRTRRVLVIDDNFDTARTFYVALRDFGYDAEFAINGYSAIELAHRFRPDIVLLDLGLPDFDGCDLARVLRGVPGVERARILAVTGAAGEDDRRRALEAGCDDYVLKPVDPLVIERMLSSRR